MVTDEKKISRRKTKEESVQKFQNATSSFRRWHDNESKTPSGRVRVSSEEFVKLRLRSLLHSSWNDWSASMLMDFVHEHFFSPKPF